MLSKNENKILDELRLTFRDERKMKVELLHCDSFRAISYMGVWLYSYFRQYNGCSWGLWVFVMTDELSVRVTENYFKDKFIGEKGLVV